jgi:hypothetical protein
MLVGVSRSSFRKVFIGLRALGEVLGIGDGDAISQENWTDKTRALPGRDRIAIRRATFNQGVWG